MQDSELYKKTMLSFLENFSMPFSSAYVNLTWKYLKAADVTDQKFQECVNLLILGEIECDTKKRPNVQQWLEWLGKKQQVVSDKQTATQEVTKILNAAREYYGDLESDHSVTLKTVEDFGGLSSLKWSLDADNPNQRKEEWLKKELLESWLTNHDLQKASLNNHLVLEESINEEMQQKVSELISQTDNKLTSGMPQRHFQKH